MMECLLQRGRPILDAVPGVFSVDGKPFAFALERASLAIPPGRYPLRFTVSARATRGELWSPDPQHRLPLVDEVPGRSGIRVHAANEYLELVGCIALGQRRAGATLLRSRAAIMPFVDRVAAASAAHEDIWLTVQPAGDELKA